MPVKDNWDKLKEEAIVVVSSYFHGDADVDGETFKRVKVATSVLSSYTRHEQTESAREQTALIVGRELCDEKDTFAEYLRVSIPRLGSNIKDIKQIKQAAS